MLKKVIAIGLLSISANAFGLETEKLTIQYIDGSWTSRENPILPMNESVADILKTLDRDLFLYTCTAKIHSVRGSNWDSTQAIYDLRDCIPSRK